MCQGLSRGKYCFLRAEPSNQSARAESIPSPSFMPAVPFEEEKGRVAGRDAHTSSESANQRVII